MTEKYIIKQVITDGPKDLFMRISSGDIDDDDAWYEEILLWGLVEVFDNDFSYQVIEPLDLNHEEGTFDRALDLFNDIQIMHKDDIPKGSDVYYAGRRTPNKGEDYGE